MANLTFILEEVEGLSAADRVTVMEKLVGLIRADLQNPAPGVASAGRSGALTGFQRGRGTGELVGDPYNMKGEGA
ncbi:MAG: hypothetical protein ACAI44_10165 [Candidatus Sericytochromatia bacterium]